MRRNNCYKDDYIIEKDNILNWNMSKAKYLFESGYNKWWKRLKVVERFDKTQNELKRLVEK